MVANVISGKCVLSASVKHNKEKHARNTIGIVGTRPYTADNGFDSLARSFM